MINIKNGMKIVQAGILLCGITSYAGNFNAFSKQSNQGSGQGSVQDSNDNGTTYADASVAHSTFTRKMLALKVQEQFECPLFSNSPYVDILTAIDSMQSGINAMVPNCEHKSQITAISDNSEKLKNEVAEIKAQTENGSGSVSQDKLFKALTLAKTLQKNIDDVSQIKVTRCFKSQKEFRNVLFTANETFQSISPIVIHFINENPILTKSVEPLVKILTGGEQISKSISLIEQIAKDSVMFDMNDSTTRINTIKNVCQFMKVYRRVQYLRLSKSDLTQKLYKDYQSKIDTMQKNIDRMKKEISSKSGTLMSQSDDSLFTDSDDIQFKLYETLKVDNRVQLAKVYKNEEEWRRLEEKYQMPKLAQCQLVYSMYKDTKLQTTIARGIEFSKSLRDEDEHIRMKDTLDLYGSEIDSAKQDRNEGNCVKYGEDYILVVKNLLELNSNQISSYEKIKLENDPRYAKRVQVDLEKDKLKKEQLNYNSIKTLVQISYFEPSEIEKKFTDMHRFFLNGPEYNEIKYECEQGDTSCKGKSELRKFQVWFQNEGPVYALLKNDEEFFDFELAKVSKAISKALTKEHLMLVKENGGKVPADKKKFDQLVLKAQDLSHITPKYYPVGTGLHREMCRELNIGINSFLKATTYLASSEAMCGMIFPALNSETNISRKLLNYCQPIGNNKSQLQRNAIKVIGFRNFDPANPGTIYQNTYQGSIQAYMEKFLVKSEELKCEDNN